MRNSIATFLLIGFISLFHDVVSLEKIKVNLKDHGYDGVLSRDPKTGLIRPPLNDVGVDSVDNLTLDGPYAHLYCKVLNSGSIFHTRFWTNFCQKKENGRKIDLCCAGYTCTDYGFPTGLRGYCKNN